MHDYNTHRIDWNWCNLSEELYGKNTIQQQESLRKYNNNKSKNINRSNEQQELISDATAIIINTIHPPTLRRCTNEIECH